MNGDFSRPACRASYKQRRKHEANDLIPEVTFLGVRLIIKHHTAKEGQATFVAITAMLTSNYIKSF